MNEAKHRLFFALWPDPELAEHLHALGVELVRQAHGRGRPMAPATLHLTLAFVGAVSRAQRDELVEAAAKIIAPEFEMTLDRLGFWPRGGIVYVAGEIVPSRQRRLFDALAELLVAQGIAADPRPWQPHVTLARNVRGLRPPRLGEGLHWRARDFVLVESHLHPAGARYEILGRWPLVVEGEA